MGTTCGESIGSCPLPIYKDSSLHNVSKSFNLITTLTFRAEKYINYTDCNGNPHTVTLNDSSFNKVVRTSATATWQCFKEACNQIYCPDWFRDLKYHNDRVADMIKATEYDFTIALPKTICGYKYEPYVDDYGCTKYTKVAYGNPRSKTEKIKNTGRKLSISGSGCSSSS